jgi:glycosyltransferase involved in cell wall biosynthesis
MVIVQKNDIKSRKWAKYIEKEFREVKIVNGSPMYMLPVTVKHIRNVDCLVFRYLNDYPEIYKTLLRFVLECCTLFISCITEIKVLWICHNVDDGSYKNYPLIAKARRLLMAKLSHRVYVTAGELIEPASSNLGIKKNKIDSISFGKFDVSKNNVNKKFEKKCKSFSSGSEKMLVGLWVGNLKNKNMCSLEKSLDLVKSKFSDSIKIIIVGSISSYLNENGYSKLFEQLKNNSNILIYDGYLDVKESVLTHEIDFFWRGVTDLSIPETLYHAVSEKYPICTPSGTFFGKYVEKNDIGTSIDTKSCKDIERAMGYVKNWSKSNAEKFLANHKWRSLAMSLRKEINSSN